MVVAHNLQAANASRMLGLTVNGIAKDAEKLSSGYRINRAADDAAGLAISEKMRAQIRGLNRASMNALDGISVIQVAEGAFGEMQSMLHRINELCTQAANDTNTDEDRKQIQQEIDQLVYEIDETTQRTQFNTKKILSGVNKRDASGNVDPNAEGEPGKLTYFSGKNNFSGKLKSGTSSLDFDENEGKGTMGISIPGQPIYGTLFGFDPYFGSTQDEVDRADHTEAEYAAFSYTNPAGVNRTLQAILSTTTNDPAYPALSKEELLSQVRRAEAIAGYSLGADNYVNGFEGMEALIRRDYGEDIKSISIGFDEHGARAILAETWADQNDPFEMKLQVGSLSGQTITISIEHLNARGLGINGIFVDSFEDAGKGMDAAQKAIDKISTTRAKLGAQQNRLEHTIANLDNTAENISAAESRIRDTDMAKTMVSYTKNQILLQAGQSILSQANTSTQGVLSLLR